MRTLNIGLLNVLNRLNVDSNHFPWGWKNFSWSRKFNIDFFNKKNEMIERNRNRKGEQIFSIDKNVHRWKFRSGGWLHIIFKMYFSDVSWHKKLYEKCLPRVCDTLYFFKAYDYMRNNINVMLRYGKWQHLNLRDFHLWYFFLGCRAVTKQWKRESSRGWKITDLK